MPNLEVPFDTIFQDASQEKRKDPVLELKDKPINPKP